MTSPLVPSPAQTEGATTFGCDGCGSPMGATDAVCGHCGRSYETKVCVRCGSSFVAHRLDAFSECEKCSEGPSATAATAESEQADLAAPDDGLTYAESVTEFPPPPRFILRHFELAAGRANALHGNGGVGKTIWSTSSRIAVAGGLPDAWGGLLVDTHGDVAHVSWEMPSARPRCACCASRAGAAWYRSLGRRHGFVCFPDWYLNSKDAESRLLRICEGRALVVFDSLRAGTPGAKENDSEQRQYLNLLTRVSEKTGAMNLVLAHDDKGGIAMRGSSAQKDALGSEVQALAKDRGIQLLQIKASIGAGGGPRTVRFVDEGPLIAGTEFSETLVIKNQSRAPGAGEVVAGWNERAEALRVNEAAARVALEALGKSEELTQGALLESDELQAPDRARCAGCPERRGTRHRREERSGPLLQTGRPAGERHEGGGRRCALLTCSRTCSREVVGNRSRELFPRSGSGTMIPRVGIVPSVPEPFREQVHNTCSRGAPLS